MTSDATTGQGPDADGQKLRVLEALPSIRFREGRDGYAKRDVAELLEAIGEIQALREKVASGVEPIGGEDAEVVERVERLRVNLSTERGGYSKKQVDRVLDKIGPASQLLELSPSTPLASTCRLVQMLSDVKFDEEFRGYNKGEVDAALAGLREVTNRLDQATNLGQAAGELLDAGNHQFSVSMRGYNKLQVDRILDSLTKTASELVTSLSNATTNSPQT